MAGVKGRSGAKKGNKNAVGNKGGGRKKIYQKRFATVARNLTLLGKSKAFIAETLEVSEGIIYKWEKDHIEFFEALNNAKHETAANVLKKGLIERAMGYEYEEESDTPKGYVKHKKHMPANPYAAMQLLSNWFPDEWRRTDKEPTQKEQEKQVTKVEVEIVTNKKT